MNFTCADVRRELDAFVDGELVGARRLLVADHLGGCSECAVEEQAIRQIGDELRGALPAGRILDLSGLAGGIVSRIRAEQAQSWRAMLHRAVEDWHWFLVGAGSVAAGCFSVAFLSALLWFGPSPQRDDSLEALLNRLGAPAGTLIMLASPVGSESDPMVLQFDGSPTGQTSRRVVIPIGFSGPTEFDLVRALSDTIVARDGRMNDSRLMSRTERERAEGFLEEIQRLQYASPPPWPGTQVAVRRLGLVTNVVCTGKALAP